MESLPQAGSFKRERSHSCCTSVLEPFLAAQLYNSETHEEMNDDFPWNTCGAPFARSLCAVMQDPYSQPVHHYKMRMPKSGPAAQRFHVVKVSWQQLAHPELEEKEGTLRGVGSIETQTRTHGDAFSHCPCGTPDPGVSVPEALNIAHTVIHAHTHIKIKAAKPAAGSGHTARHEA